LPAKDARLVNGVMIIKHKLCLSDEETIEQFRENSYLQYFVGLSEIQRDTAFSPMLFVEIRRRMEEEVFEEFNQAIVKQMQV
jgi:IS5 family transposase